MLLAWLCLMTAGCGSARPVMEGTVTLDGVPIEKGTIMVVPADGKGQTAGCGIEAGRYSMQAALGTKQVVISANRKDGKMPDPASPGSGAMIDRYVESVPKRYNDEFELTVTVKPGRNVADFALEAAVLKTPDASPKRDSASEALRSAEPHTLAGPLYDSVGSSRASSTTTGFPASSTTPAHETASCGSMLTSVA